MWWLSARVSSEYKDSSMGSVDIQTGVTPRIEQAPRILGVHYHGFHGKGSLSDAFCHAALKKFKKSLSSTGSCEVA